jgi:hypothetical protein
LRDHSSNLIQRECRSRHKTKRNALIGDVKFASTSRVPLELTDSGNETKNSRIH